MPGEAEQCTCSPDLGVSRLERCRDAITYVAAITEKVNQVSGLQINAWAATFSPSSATITWATFVEHLEQLEQANDKLAVADDYIDLVEKNAHLFAGPLQDGLSAVVHGGPDPAATAPPAYVSVARAVAANGKLTQAFADGVEIADQGVGGHRASDLVPRRGHRPVRRLQLDHRLRQRRRARRGRNEADDGRRLAGADRPRRHVLHRGREPERLPPPHLTLRTEAVRIGGGYRRMRRTTTADSRCSGLTGRASGRRGRATRPGRQR